MSWAYLWVGAYLGSTLLLGWLHRRRAADSAIEFFLAGRGLSPVLLFFTMAATNFSAFTIFGLSGAGYRMGYAFFPVMGYATGFMALSFIMIGVKVRRLSTAHGYVTPADFIQHRYQSRILTVTVSLVLIVFTVPYVAIQTIAGGRLLAQLLQIPYGAAATALSIFVVLYVGLGGMRSIAWTDLVQGVLMVGTVLLAYVLIVRSAGGLVAVHEALLQHSPEHLQRPGAGPPGSGGLSPSAWFGYYVLWFFADPLFPQLFQRFLAARNEGAINRTVVLYPLVTTGLFFLTVSIGVVGRAVLPGLTAAESDSVFTLLLLRTVGPALAAILLTGALAAIMSTMDSQLLTVASMVSRDFPRPRMLARVRYERIVVFVAAAAGLSAALRPPETLLAFINATTFNGLAVLTVPVLGGLYWRKGSARGALVSVVLGEALVLLSFFRVIQPAGIMPILFIIPAVILTYLAVSVLDRTPQGNPDLVFPISRRAWRWTPVVLVLLLAGNDFWNWGRLPRLMVGLPDWVWYYLVLGVVLSLAFHRLTRE